MRKLISLIAVAMILAAGGCINGLVGISGDGNVIKESRSIGTFNVIDASGGLDIVLVKNGSGNVEVTTDKNLMPNVETYVRGKTLYVKSRNIRNSTELEVRIGYETIRHMELSGAVDVSSTHPIDGEKLTIDASGASELDLVVEVEELKMDMSGASEVTLSGQVESYRFEGSGASSLDAEELTAREVRIRISGAGDARIHATEKLSANVSGAGSVRYSGNPEIINKSVSGAGSITQK